MPITPFDRQLARSTGIDPRVIAAWHRAEGGPNDNPLNIGPGRHYPDPVAATAKLINTSHYYKGIRASRGKPSATISAIKNSPWDAGHYANGVLDRTAAELGIKKGQLSQFMGGGPTPSPTNRPQGDTNKQALLQYLMQSSAAMSQGLPNPSIVPLLGQMKQAPQSGSGEASGVVIEHNEKPSPHTGNIIQLAKKYMGTKYVWGGSSPKTGFDCSGFVQWLYGQQGVKLGRTTYDQIKQGQHIGLKGLRPGDVVFFSKSGDVHHEGMYIGNGQFIHAPHTGDVIKISSLSDPYYSAQFAGGRRMVN